MEVRERHLPGGWIDPEVNAGQGNDQAIQGQQAANEKPDRDLMIRMMLHFYLTRK
jgi:hypothetical protein